MSRPLRVFLCHSSHDKPAVRALYQRLRAEGWIQPWFDEEELYPGQDWNLEIEKAIEATDVIIVCLSNNSITQEGYVQREIRIALDYADYKPEGTLFIIPVRLQECTPPKRLARWQYADYFEGQRERGVERLLVSLQRRADSLGLEYDPADRAARPVKAPAPQKSQAAGRSEGTPKPVVRPASPPAPPGKITLSNGMEFLRAPAGAFLMGSADDDQLAYDDEKPQHSVEIPYDYWMARYPVTNTLYNAYVAAKGIKHPVKDWEGKKDHPVVSVSWKDALAYCRWLDDLMRAELPPGLALRLPSEAEWEKAARGSDGRIYPWGNQFDPNKCNTSEGGKRGATPVGAYSPQGDSPCGCADMSGNVWEWTRSLWKAYPYKAEDGREVEKESGSRVLRGGSFNSLDWSVRCAVRDFDVPYYRLDFLGFRLCVSPISLISEL
ncbi:MAG: SUMF1/EgtB/PvdO family nonheme iron enzyme [Chloroflexota bacterium]